MSPARLRLLFRREASVYGLEHVRLGLDPTVPRSPRAMAYTEGTSVFFYRRALALPEDNVIALIRHELGHVILNAGGYPDHSERDADDVAEQVWGEPIRYDGCDVQTLGPGRRPRPRGLAMRRSGP